MRSTTRPEDGAPLASGVGWGHLTGLLSVALGASYLLGVYAMLSRAFGDDLGGEAITGAASSVLLAVGAPLVALVRWQVHRRAARRIGRRIRVAPRVIAIVALMIGSVIAAWSGGGQLDAFVEAWQLRATQEAQDSQEAEDELLRVLGDTAEALGLSITSIDVDVSPCELSLEPPGGEHEGEELRIVATAAPADRGEAELKRAASEIWGDDDGRPVDGDIYGHGALFSASLYLDDDVPTFVILSRCVAAHG
jgi:hypothetical protein